MAFELDEQYKLTFKGVRGMDGMEIIMLPMSIGVALTFQEFQEKKATREEDREDLRKMMQLVTDHIVSWNLTRGGEPVPVSVDEVQKFKTASYHRLVREWDKASSDISDPLGDGSTSGDSSPEASVPTAALSLDQSSTPMPAGS